MSEALEKRLRELVTTYASELACSQVLLDALAQDAARIGAEVEREECDADLTALAELTRSKGYDRERYGVLDARDTIRARGGR